MKKQVENKNIKKKYPKIRFKEFSETWEQCKVIDLLNFIRPDKYIVQNEKYIKGALTPVLTANKSFIIGHTKEKKTFKKNCIIFDDFTLNIKYVNFPFMVKSSVIKILIETENNNLFFIYLLLKNKNFKPFGHMSHYVNFVQNISLEKIKNKEEQDKIAKLFSKIYNLITLHQKKLDLLKKFKKTLLEKMFSLNEESFPKIRFNGFFDAWEQCKVGNLFYVNRGETLLKHEISNFRNFKNKYPVYSSQTTNNGLMGYYKTYLFENAITWTTDGYAGNFNYRPEKFYSTTHNGTLTPKNYFVNFALAEMLNFVSEKYITKATIPLLTSTDVKNITFWAPKINEQTKISNLIFTLNNLITLHQKKLKLIQKFKKTLLEKMFV
ncbi:restriction endonuclease subunit S [Mycoplasmopsis synoviae]|uniref:restriction endonuclease subunit S n=2 Tax=Mycoplasmopsis synoviae TaxID=2109 RepID=UPI001EF99DD8|nr:restriction endonuclease subunit S [Mycoplasmopsis synoviae]ULL02426.1 restriction endonuclease subunit S [Mycoplasmopsis synoviae]